MTLRLRILGILITVAQERAARNDIHWFVQNPDEVQWMRTGDFDPTVAVKFQPIAEGEAGISILE
jgi:hypothetical protein